MSTTIYLSNDVSDMSGFLLAYIGTRSPIASTTSVAVAVTNTTAGSTTVGMTLVAGATTVGGVNTAKWITRPLSAAVTLDTPPFANFWTSVDALTANAFPDLQLFNRTAAGVTSTAAFLTTSLGTFASQTTTAAVAMRSAYLATTGIGQTVMISQAFAVGDRLVIAPFVDSSALSVQAAGVMRFNYNGGTEGANGDAFVVFDQDIQTTTAQGPSQPKGPSLSHFEDLRVHLAALTSFTGQTYSMDAKVEAVLNELAAQRDREGA